MLPRIPRDWVGETVFVVAGGPSVRGVNLDRLRGRRVVVVNSSYAACPWADVLVFTDLRWWREHESRVRATFRGEVVTISPRHALYEGLTVYERQRSSGLSTDPTRLTCWHTSITTVINHNVLRGAQRTMLLGVDGAGGWHHEPHPERWHRNAHKFYCHGLALESLVAPLRAARHQVYNINSDSTHRMFPFMSLDDVLASERELVS